MGSKKPSPKPIIPVFFISLSEMPNGSKFYTPTAKVDFSEEFEITEEDEKLFHDFNDFIKNFNDYICKQWEEKVQTEQKNPSAADVETVEDFIDIDVDK